MKPPLEYILANKKIFQIEYLILRACFKTTSDRYILYGRYFK